MQNRSKVDKARKERDRGTGQTDRRTSQTGQTGPDKRVESWVKPVKPALARGRVDVEKESLSAGEAARELGISPRTLRRLCSAGQLPSFSTPGGQVRVWRIQLDAYRQGLGQTVANTRPSPVLENKREALQNLTLELQERRLTRDLKKLEEEDARVERVQSEAAQAEQLRRNAILEQARLQRQSREEEREREREELEDAQARQLWVDSWVEHALKSLPSGVPRALALHIQEAVEDALSSSSVGPERPRSIVERLVAGVVETALAPWTRQQAIEQAIRDAKKELPFAVQTFSEWFPPSEWETRAVTAARNAVAMLDSDASLAEVRTAAVNAGRLVAAEYETTQNQLRDAQQRQRLASSKAFLVSIGVAEVGSYLKKLHLDDEIFDEDLNRKDELEQRVRSALEERLAGGEVFSEAVRIAREVVNAEV